MKALLRRQRLVDLAIIGSLFVAACATMYALIHHQRTLDMVELNRLMIESTQRTMEKVKAEVDRLEVSNYEVRQTVQPLRGLSKAIEVIKDTAEAKKAEGKP